MAPKNVVDLRNKQPQRPVQPALFSPPPERSGKRVSPVRVRRRRARLIVVIVVIVLLAAAVYGVHWISYQPRYTVQSVSVVGAQQVPSSAIYDYAESLLHSDTHSFFSKDNIFLYNPGALQREILGHFPRLASVTVSRASLFSTAVTVTVAERQPYAIWCADTAQADCYQMDHTGFIFAQAPAPNVLSADAGAIDATSSPQAATSTPGGITAPQGQYVFQGGIATSTVATSTDSTGSPQAGATIPISPIGQTFAGTHMPGIVALLELLGQAGFSPTGAIVQDGQDFWVPLSEGFYIKTSFGENPHSLVSNLQLVLSSSALNGQQSKLEYVDLRFGDRVYYKLQGQGEAQTSS